MKKSNTPTILFKLTEEENAQVEAKASGRPEGSKADWYKSMFLVGVSAFKPVKQAKVVKHPKVEKVAEEKPIVKKVAKAKVKIEEVPAETIIEYPKKKLIKKKK